MEIINKTVEFNNNTCQRVTNNSKIQNVNNNDILRISEPFENLRNGEEMTSTIDSLKKATEDTRALTNRRNLTRVRTKELEKNGGFILVSGATILGTLTAGTMIFMAIKQIIAG